MYKINVINRIFYLLLYQFETNTNQININTNLKFPLTLRMIPSNYYNTPMIPRNYYLIPILFFLKKRFEINRISDLL